MNFLYNDTITKFHEQLGVTKELIEDTFNKPDATDVIVDKAISIKNYGQYYILVVTSMADRVVRFLNAYRIYPKMLDGVDIGSMSPTDALKAFMEAYGLEIELPMLGMQKFFIERKRNVFFPGVLDIEKYVETVKAL